MLALKANTRTIPYQLCPVRNPTSGLWAVEVVSDSSCFSLLTTKSGRTRTLALRKLKIEWYLPVHASGLRAGMVVCKTFIAPVSGSPLSWKSERTRTWRMLALKAKIEQYVIRYVSWPNQLKVFELSRSWQRLLLLQSLDHCKRIWKKKDMVYLNVEG